MHGYRVQTRPLWTAGRKICRIAITQPCIAMCWLCFMIKAESDWRDRGLKWQCSANCHFLVSFASIVNVILFILRSNFPQVSDAQIEPVCVACKVVDHLLDNDQWYQPPPSIKTLTFENHTECECKPMTQAARYAQQPAMLSLASLNYLLQIAQWFNWYWFY